MVATTRSKVNGTITKLLGASKAGVTKRTKSSSAGGRKPDSSRKTSTQIPTTEVVEVREKPASPHGTNAPLIAPQANSTAVLLIKQDASATTNTILDQAIVHLLSVDPSLKLLVESHDCGIFSAEGLAELVHPFQSLVSGIISQQVSGAAARTIKARFIDLFTPTPTSQQPFFPTPEMVVACPNDKLRSAGLSGRKAEYVVSLAEHFIDGTLSPEVLATAPDAEVIEKLIKVRGIGNWSAEMFLMFGLKRMDVFSTGDLGIQRGMAAHFGKDVAKLKSGGKGKWKYMSEADMLRLSEGFKPYRSLFMWYMWRASDVSVDALTEDGGAAKGKGKAKAKKA
ncbi:DNA glycosylase [Choiromyces venosus 120613-1]|uniref:DNA glycosylase n=1 Tax=Choiromyces venosus 120613-1 TaxID=1336337 RepID=A0A3N4JI41_9PEZI|nr:DNA glycosylase [Choiromyces venosus 120613-1]